MLTYEDAQELSEIDDENDALIALYGYADSTTDEDETFYVSSILSGEYDDEKDALDADYGDYAEDNYDADWEARDAGDRWERSYWGD